MTTFAFAPSVYLPIAIGFFGLGTGYFIWGGQALFGFPADNPETNRTMGMWALWMPGFMQFLTGIVLLIGLTWFNVFGKYRAPLHGGCGVHSVWYPLVRSGAPPLHWLQRST